MNYEIVTLPEQTAAGIKARTNNASPDMKNVIRSLWERFYQSGVNTPVFPKTNCPLLGIYTDYAGDEKGDYTVIVGCAASQAPQDTQLSVCKIPAGRYAKFAVQGNTPAAVAHAWENIWAMNLPRSFVCDFEEYQNNGSKNSTIYIYIGLKNISYNE